jgi:hypothetical protein
VTPRHATPLNLRATTAATTSLSPRVSVQATRRALLVALRASLNPAAPADVSGPVAVISWIQRTTIAFVMCPTQPSPRLPPVSTTQPPIPGSPILCLEAPVSIHLPTVHITIHRSLSRCGLSVELPVSLPVSQRPTAPSFTAIATALVTPDSIVRTLWRVEVRVPCPTASVAATECALAPLTTQGTQQGVPAPALVVLLRHARILAASTPQRRRARVLPTPPTLTRATVLPNSRTVTHLPTAIL